MTPLPALLTGMWWGTLICWFACREFMLRAGSEPGSLARVVPAEGR